MSSSLFYQTSRQCLLADNVFWISRINFNLKENYSAYVENHLFKMNSTYMEDIKSLEYDDNSKCPTSKYEWTTWNSMKKESNGNDDEQLIRHRSLNSRWFWISLIDKYFLLQYMRKTNRNWCKRYLYKNWLEI